ncbi:MAG: hypothetical protein M0027_08590, partial [Candidatus Dormibacteraeota bacterium]|nr:hypothetical protein [Candidatus Dormibacteraeota bacterium]
GCAAARQDGTAADPIAVWHDLARDRTSPLAYAEAFRSRLGIPLQELVPASLQSPSGPLLPGTWAAERRRGGEQLGTLMSEYRSRRTG